MCESIYVVGTYNKKLGTHGLKKFFGMSGMEEQWH